jgi:hypothetical protein
VAVSFRTGGFPPVTATDVVLVAQAIASGAMAGIAWFVQVVHYPLFSRIPPGTAGDYARENQRITSRVVLPPMLVEAAAATWLAVGPPPGVGRAAALVGLALVGLTTLSTAVVQVPLHAQLAAGHDPAVVARLVRSTWLRTAAWSARAVLAAWMLRAG